MSEDKLLKEGWRKFLKIIKETHQLEQLFHLLLTKEEKASLSKRTLIIKALVKAEKTKKTQREVAKDLKVSIAKITRGSNELKGIDRGFKKFLDDEFL